MAMESPKTPETPQSASSSSLMDHLLGLLRVKIIRGINLAVRDRLKTRVIKKDINPEWNEDLTLSISDPNLPIKLTVYDHDTFSKDDKMGEAEFEIKTFIDALRMNLDTIPSGTIITKLQPSRQNCLAEESNIVREGGRIVQNLCLRLKNVECGEVEVQLHWIDLPGCKGL